MRTKTPSLLFQAQKFLGLVFLLAFFFLCLPAFSFAQDDGGDGKEKKEKTEKVKKEKPEKVKKEKPTKEKKEKLEKVKKEKPSKADDEDDDSGDEKRKKKTKKKKKGDDDVENKSTGDGANTANEKFHANNSDSTVVHGRAVPCARYQKGGMEYIDKNNVYVAIKRTRRKEIHINGNKGIHGEKESKKKKGKSKDKGNKLVFRIVWQADCEYKLIFKRSKKPTKFKKGWEMDCRIIACYEDFYDCDCDIHDIMQFASIHKRLTKRELAQREAIRQDSIETAIADSIATIEELERVRLYEEEEKARAANDEIFGPIRRIDKPDDAESRRGNNEENGNDEAVKKEGEPKEKVANKEKPAKEKPEKEEKEEKEEKDPDLPKAKKEKKEKAPKEKKEKVPKEKKAKAPKEKKEKAPKEKKEKAPKEKKEKAPKEKKEKAPKPEKDAEE